MTRYVQKGHPTKSWLLLRETKTHLLRDKRTASKQPRNNYWPRGRNLSWIFYDRSRKRQDRLRQQRRKLNIILYLASNTVILIGKNVIPPRDVFLTASFFFGYRVEAVLGMTSLKLDIWHKSFYWIQKKTSLNMFRLLNRELIPQILLLLSPNNPKLNKPKNPENLCRFCWFFGWERHTSTI